MGNDLEDGKDSDSLGHQKLHQPEHLFGEDDKAQGRKADQKRGEKFNENVAVEDFGQGYLTGNGWQEIIIESGRFCKLLRESVSFLVPLVALC